MEDGLSINSLPDWRYAGKRADSVVINARGQVDGQQIAYLLHPAAHPDPAKNQDQQYETREYVVEKGYLIPRYPATESSYRRREEKLLMKRVQRFFYSCEQGLDATHTGQQIAQELKLFDHSLAAINEERAQAGEPPLSLSTPYSQMSAKERMLVNQGAQFVGHAVNRLGRLGSIILEGHRGHVNFEHDDDYVRDHMDEIKSEFKQLWIKIAFGEESLVRCVMTRDGKPDHDGVFHDLIREMAKPVMTVIEQENIADTSTPETEVRTHQNIATKIGDTLEAIDQVAATMRLISYAPNFCNLSKRTIDKIKRDHERPPQEEDSILESPVPKDLSPASYRSLMNEFVEICRARACIKSEDADNFSPVATRFRFLEKELTLQHQVLFQGAKYSVMGKGVHDETSEKAVTLLKRGVLLMSEMAELRMPRNDSSVGVYDRGTQGFKDRDASSVGRYEEEVKHFLERTKQIPVAASGSFAQRHEASQGAERSGR